MIPLLLLLWVCAAGAPLALRLDQTSTRLSETLALAASLGLAIFAGFGFVLGWAFGLSMVTVTGSAVLTTAISLALGAKASALWNRARAYTRPTLGVIVVSVLSAALVTRLADRTLFETDTGIATSDRHNFGDLPFHMSIAAGFAYGDNFPPDHPELAGVPLTYPFFCDLLSAMILTVGGSWRDAFFWPTFFLGLSVVVALVRFGEAITGSRALGRAGAGLTFFSGGLGFIALSSTESLTRWWTLGPDLTANDAGIRYANFVTTLFIPQRSILFGWPLLFFGLALLIDGLKKTPTADGTPSQSSLWQRAGVVASLLPLVHAHSFAVMGFCFLFLSVQVERAAIPAFIRGVAPLAVPAVLFMLTHNSLSTGRFLAWQPGFDGGAGHPFSYWLMNGGLFLPLVVIGIARASASVRFPASPFLALFVLANLFRMSPWIWDNMKFLAPAHAGLAPFASLALASLWKQSRAGKAASVLAFVVATLSGSLDIAKVALSGEYGIFSRTDLVFAEKVRRATPSNATILTAPTHNHAVLLSGRRLFLGYEGHLWSQGLDYSERKPVAAALFRGEPQPPKSASLRRVDAIALTPAEEGVIPNPDVLRGLPSLVDSPYRLLKIR
ncbi:MAG: hypothetical protein JJE39_08025 [Vicinamibacteria bacterium]|nr:hypothetical protein [Vicinamibacteria bacterium]